MRETTEGDNGMKWVKVQKNRCRNSLDFKIRNEERKKGNDEAMDKR
jgi:hypothetical protein